MRLAAVWRWSTWTAGAGSDTRRQQARLLASLLFSLLVLIGLLGLILLLVPKLNRAPPTTTALILIANLALLGLAYGLNRAGHSRAAAWLVVLLGTASGWLSVLLTLNSLGQAPDILLYPLLPILLSGLLLPGWTTAALSAGNIALLLLVGAAYHLPPGADVYGLAIFYAFVCGLTSLAATLRRHDLARLDVQAQALSASEAKYHHIVDLAQEGIWTVDGANLTTFVNRKMTQMLGYADEEIIGTEIFKFMDPAEQTVAPAGLEQRRQALTGQHDVKFLARDGSELWTIVSGTALSDPAGNFAGILGLVTDITARRSTEASLRDSQARFQSAFTFAPIGMALVAPDGHWLQANPALCDILGYSETELLSTNFQTVTHPDDLDADWQQLRRALAGEIVSYQIEKRYYHKQGGLVWVMLAVSLVRDSRGDPLYFVSQVQDITERKRGLDALRESGERYRQMFEEAERLRQFNSSIAEVMAEGLAMEDAEGRITLVNPKLLNSLGYSADELIGQHWTMLIAPRDLERVMHITAQRAAGIHSIYEAWLQTKSGQELPALVSATPLMKSGRFAGTLATLTDISDRKRAEDALQAANVKLTAWLAESEQRTREISLLNELGELLQTALTADEAFTIIAHSMLALFPYTAGRLYVIKESRNLVEATTHWGPVAGQADPFEPSQCWALRRGRIHIVEHLGPDMPPERLAAVVCSHVTHPRPSAYICVPMVAQGDTLGVVHLQRPVPVASGADERQLNLTEDQVRLARAVADSLALALANLRLRERLQRQSIRDPLTGLFNRRYLEETLEREINRAQRDHQPLGVMMLDIDHFKQCNDTYGHQAGDRLLRELGAVIAAHARGADIACRYGGEEFILILPGASLAVTRQRAEGVCEAVRQIYVAYGPQVSGVLTVSVGVAAYPEHGANADDCVRAADTALYQAKRAGRDRVAVAA
jgi:diguanylate cyclase (GGDEF)-like protein/PAS domain S-box-containing protein